MTLIAVDGPAGAGKTTLAATLERDFSTQKKVSVIHMDDLYAGWNNPFDEHLSAKLEVIVHAFNAHRSFNIEIFNWIKMTFDSSKTIKPSDILIIEGVGAAQKVVRDAGAITYWLDVEPSVGLERVLHRDGFEIENQMHQWQIDQEVHFTNDGTRTHASHIITS